MFKSFALPVLAAAAAVATPAAAHTVITDLGVIVVPPTQTFTPGVIFTAAGMNKSAWYTFTISQAMTLSVSSFTNSAIGTTGEFDFSTIGLYSGLGDTGTMLETGTINPRAAGTEMAYLDQYSLDAGTYTIAYSGSAVGVPASIGSSITFAAGAVPEPATWAMMITGFGLVGGMARSRKVRAALA